MMMPVGSNDQQPAGTVADERMPVATFDSTGTIRIGRDEANDIVLRDFWVSRKHAEIRRIGADYHLVDLASSNGLHHNGRRVPRAMLAAGDLFTIGRHEFLFDGKHLFQHDDQGPTSIIADDLTVQIGKAVLLDDVSFALRHGTLLGIVGPSGCGKSTLLKTMTGFRPASQGKMLYDNKDLYQHYSELRYRIGLVPQDDVLHRQLTVRRALRFAAALRFSHDVPRKQRSHRVNEVLDLLGLTNRAKQRIDTLSGGQRKRTSVALELLTEPSLLALDEPTSGLDPALDKEVMRELRLLADRGRTVVVVTHSVLHLDLCDYVLVMCLGGRMGYFGPPDELLSFFDAEDYADVFDKVTNDAARWAQRYRNSEVYRKYVGEVALALANRDTTPALPVAIPTPRAADPTPTPRATEATPTTPTPPTPEPPTPTPPTPEAPPATPEPPAPDVPPTTPEPPAPDAPPMPAVPEYIAEPVTSAMPSVAPPAPGAAAPAPAQRVPAPAPAKPAAAQRPATAGPRPKVKLRGRAAFGLPPKKPGTKNRSAKSDKVRFADAKPGKPTVGTAQVQDLKMTQRALHPVAPFRQFLTLCLRMFAVIISDRGYAIFLVGLPLALAALSHTIPGGTVGALPKGLSPDPAGYSLEANRILIVFVTGAAFMGLAIAIREIVNEASIYRRERAIGLSPTAYLGSKLLVFIIIDIIQATIFVYLALWGRGAPREGLFLKTQPMAEIIVAVALVAISSTVIGLLASALVKSTEQTTPILVVTVMAQLVLSGGLFAITGQGALEYISWIDPSRWGFAATAATTELLNFPFKDPLWDHVPANWWRGIVVLLAQIVILSVFTRFALRRFEPGKG
jgi:ABC-type multidrug transport system ATPase subunit